MTSLIEVAPGKQHRPARRSRTRPVPIRTMRLLLPVQGEDKPGLLKLTVNGDAQTYWLSPIESPLGRAFTLRKLRSADEYHVLLRQDGHTCDCKGGTYHGYFKHQDAVAELVARGSV
jgi:hypothetical protein